MDHYNRFLYAFLLSAFIFTTSTPTLGAVLKDDETRSSPTVLSVKAVKALAPYALGCTAHVVTKYVVSWPPYFASFPMLAPPVSNCVAFTTGYLISQLTRSWIGAPPDIQGFGQSLTQTCTPYASALTKAPFLVGFALLMTSTQLPVLGDNAIIPPTLGIVGYAVSHSYSSDDSKAKSVYGRVAHTFVQYPALAGFAAFAVIECMPHVPPTLRFTAGLVSYAIASTLKDAPQT
ncbi:MAG: hypothetical protein V6Z78_02935 [Holosporaceae bacterium]